MNPSAGYRIRIKANPGEIMIPGLRALLFLSLLLLLFTEHAQAWYRFHLPCLLLLAAALTLGKLVYQYKFPLPLVAVAAGLLLFFATGNWIMPILIILIFLLLRYSYRQPCIDINDQGIQIRKSFSNQLYDWGELSNVVIKDQLITIDFKNNRLLQLETDSYTCDTSAFNAFCRTKISHI